MSELAETDGPPAHHNADARRRGAVRLRREANGLLTPWRFVIVAPAKRALLAEAFALALIDRDPGATLEQIEAAREKAHRAPLLLVAIACLD